MKKYEERSTNNVDTTKIMSNRGIDHTDDDKQAFGKRSGKMNVL